MLLHGHVHVLFVCTDHASVYSDFVLQHNDFKVQNQKFYSMLINKNKNKNCSMKLFLIKLSTVCYKDKYSAQFKLNNSQKYRKSENGLSPKKKSKRIEIKEKSGPIHETGRIHGPTQGE